MPGYIIGRNELVTSSEALISGSNALALNIVLGSEPTPGKRPMMVLDLRDVARVQVNALDEEKVVLGAGESKGYLLDGGSSVKGVEFDDAKDIVKKAFPGAVADGKLELGGGVERAGLVIESSETVEAFGEMGGYEGMVKDVVGQYLELLGKE